MTRSERVCHAGDERSREAFFSILARVAQRDSDAAVGLERLAGPQDLVESAHPAMQRVRAIVLGKAIRRAVERELPIGNSIGIAADDRTEVRRVFQASGETVG